MMTECPERAMATSFSWILSSRMAVRIPSTTEEWSMMAPSTMESAGSGKTPNFLSRFSAPSARTCAIFTELDPMSSPTTSLLPNRPIESPVAPPSALEHLVPVGQRQAQRQDDLPFGVHAARKPLLHPVDRQDGELRAPRQLRLAQQQPFPYLSDVVRLYFNLFATLSRHRTR